MSEESKRELFIATKDTTSNLVSLYHDSVNIKERTKQMEIKSDLRLKELAIKYQASREYLTQIFQERRDSLNKTYDLMERAIASNDKEVILASLQSISNIVTSSPLKDFEAFAKMFDNGQTPDLDF